MGRTIRLAFIGSGGMAAAHLKAIAPMEDVEIVGFCDVDSGKCEARVTELAQSRPGAVVRTFSDPSEMIRELDPDGVYLLLPPFAHGAAERSCIESGKPFFVEKPIGLDMGLTREIAAEVERKGLLTGAGYMNRYRTGIQRGRELLKDDPAVLVHGGWISSSPNPQPGSTNIGSWWVVKEKSGGQIHEQVTHTFDIVRFLCGEATEVFAHAARGFNRGLYNYNIDDAATVNIRFASGCVANLMACCAANGGGGGVHLNVYAHDVTLLYTGWEHAARILRGGGKEVEEIPGEPDIFAVEDRIFIDALRSGDGSAILSTYPDAVRTLELTLAANQSVESGRPVVVSGS